MKFNQLIDFIKQRIWKEEEGLACFHVVSNWNTCHLGTKNIYKKTFYSTCIFSIKDSYAFEWSIVDESRDTFNWILKKYSENSRYILEKYKEFKKVSKKIEDIFNYIHKNDISSLSNENLFSLYSELYNLSKEQYEYSIITDSADTLTEKDYSMFLGKLKKNNLMKIVEKLSSSEYLSLVEREKLDLLNMAKYFLKYKKFDRKYAYNNSKFKEHVDKYFWIQNSFLEAKYLDNKYFFNLLKKSINSKNLSEVKKDIRDLENKKHILNNVFRFIYKKYKLSQKSKKFFSLIRLFSIMQDERKENIQRSVFCIDKFFDFISNRFSIEKDNLNYYLMSDIKDLLKNNRKLNKKEIKKRKNALFFSYIKNNKIKTETFYGEDGDLIRGLFLKFKLKNNTTENLKGFVASIGGGQKTIEGRVRIVYLPGKDKFLKDEILVTGMTRPEFVPIMKNAKAIVTNEGGITCHAAIISRELKIPCIIGTKVSTEVLKNGDYVQLDLVNGGIKILNNK